MTDASDEIHQDIEIALVSNPKLPLEPWSLYSVEGIAPSPAMISVDVWTDENAEPFWLPFENVPATKLRPVDLDSQVMGRWRRLGAFVPDVGPLLIQSVVSDEMNEVIEQTIDEHHEYHSTMVAMAEAVVDLELGHVDLDGVFGFELNIDDLRGGDADE